MAYNWNDQDKNIIIHPESWPSSSIDLESRKPLIVRLLSQHCGPPTGCTDTFGLYKLYPEHLLYHTLSNSNQNPNELTDMMIYEFMMLCFIKFYQAWTLISSICVFFVPIFANLLQNTFQLCVATVGSVSCYLSQTLGPQ